MPKRWVPAVLVLTMALAAGPGFPASAAPPPVRAAPCPYESIAGTLLDGPTFERAIVCLVNKQRTSLKRKPVRPNQNLRQVASRYAARMIADGFFAHRSPDGSSILSRLENAGYLEDAVEWEVGENLIWASGYGNTPAAIVQGWMGSPPHRENLLRPVFREIGVGAAVGTPFAPMDLTGITVVSEYGVARGKSGGKAKPERPARRPKR